MIQRMVLATLNPGKLREFADLANHCQLDLRPQSEFALAAVEETGLSFVENAILKARHAAEHTGLPAIADDSGLEVDALHGAPGIYSARYAGEQASDAAHVQKLLDALHDVPREMRTARYHCCLVFMRHARDPHPLIAHAVWHGAITEAPEGDGGFGYDPVFWVPETECTAAQLSAAQKQAISHRAKAVRIFIDAFSHTRHLP